MARVNRAAARQRRHARVRVKVHGTPERPRLVVFRSHEHIYAQVVDDTRGHTIAAASTVEPGVREQLAGKTKTEQARIVGELVAKRAKERGVSRVVFDRGGYQYHGRVMAVAEGARAGKLEF